MAASAQKTYLSMVALSEILPLIIISSILLCIGSEIFCRLISGGLTGGIRSPGVPLVNHGWRSISSSVQRLSGSRTNILEMRLWEGGEINKDETERYYEAFYAICLSSHT